MSEFTISSPSLKDGQIVPEHFVFDGDNVSPALEWQGAPSETKSFAVTVFDPDAPTDHGWWHWAVVNIPASVTKLNEGASNNHTLPKEAVEILTDFKRTSYGGPRPPKGDKAHRYVFSVYALKTDQLEIKPGTNSEAIKNKIKSEALALASFTVKYGR